MVNRGCFGMTNAFVCFSNDLSLHSADINGRSMFLLFSRKILMSIVLADGGVVVVVVDDVVFGFVVDTGALTMFCERK